MVSETNKELKIQSMYYKTENKAKRGSIRTVEYGQTVQKWWWAFSNSQRMILANMAGCTFDGKCITSYDQISHNFNVAYSCYEKLA